jgi:hypothetical protein
LSHPTVKQLQALKGFTWSEDYQGPVSEVNVLFWHALDELASTTEMFLAIDELEDVAPKTVQALEGGRGYFDALRTPRPHAVEIVLLKLARLKAGVDPDAQ